MAEISKQALIVENNQSFPNNNNGAITPSDLRSFNTDMIDSLVDELSYKQFTASVTNSISLLNQFSASQQPSFTALNAFTASQSVLNTGYNNATQSLSGQISVVSAEVDQLQSWSGSVNQILFNGVSAGYSTRFNFGGFLSASLVQNVNGTIADINYLQDPTKLNTSSFDAYVATTNAFTASTRTSLTAINAFTASNGNTSLNAYTASQNIINASVTASIVDLQNFSSSLSGGFATQGELDASASALQANIDTKLSTSSFEAYTSSYSQSVATSFSQSYAFINTYSASAATSLASSINGLSSSVALVNAGQTTRLDGLASFTASYATTGSNVYRGSQTITGSVYGNVSPLTISSNTASIDLSVNNLFTLNLVSGSATHLTATNILPGQTINLLISQPNVGTGSVTYGSTLKFPAGANYIATPISGAKDIITFITFDSTAIYASSINNLL